jgi:NADH-quinone oxidoreductase subunit G
MSEEQAVVETVPVTIDGIEIEVPKGTLVIRAAEMLGIDIPRFCDHPLLDPVGACRQCMVEIPDAGNGRGFPTPQAACTMTVAPGMQVKTQYSSEVAKSAQVGVQELILLNHPLDCPICDKGGECPLQNQAFANGRAESRYDGVKRSYPKPLELSPQILLDRERCVLCARCTRFSEQISGDPLIALAERGAVQQVGVFADESYDSYFSGNVVQICPVGALTAASYRFNSRPFDLVSTEVTCENCAAGCQLRTDHRHFQVRRRLAGNCPEVNEEWNCDKGRFGFVSGREERLTTPLIKENGELREASWPEAIDAAVAGLKDAGLSVAVLPGGRQTVENAYGYAKFARAVLGTNSVDFRSRPGSAEEEAFLAAKVAGVKLGDGVSYAELEQAKKVVLVCFEPEDESPIVFLRLRKAVRKKKLKVVTLAATSSRGSLKLNAELVSVAPGEEAQAVKKLDVDADTIILVGERAASVPDTLDRVFHQANDTGAKLAWIPRRAGDRGALEAGCLPGLLPGGRPVEDAKARVDIAAAWGVELPEEPGRDVAGILDEPPAALILGGLEPLDFQSTADFRKLLTGPTFVISLENRVTEVTQAADVVFPVALLEEQSGHFYNWEHRIGVVNRVNTQATTVMTDLRVLAALADALGKPLGIRSTAQAWQEFSELGTWDGGKPNLVSPAAAPKGEGYRLATWRQLLDNSRSIDGADRLQATARRAVVRISPKTAKKLGVSCGDQLTVTGPEGKATLPVAITQDLRDDTVWVPGNDMDICTSEMGVVHGSWVTLSRGGEEA